MKIQLNKVCWMLRSLSQLDWDLFILSCEGRPVRQETHVIYLGELILGMTQHIAHIAMRAKSALGRVRYAASQNIKLSSLGKLVPQQY